MQTLLEWNLTVAFYSNDQEKNITTEINKTHILFSSTVFFKIKAIVEVNKLSCKPFWSACWVGEKKLSPPT